MCEDALARGLSLRKFRHAVLVHVFVSKLKGSKQQVEAKKKDELIEELLRLADVRMPCKDCNCPTLDTLSPGTKGEGFSKFSGRQSAQTTQEIQS